MKSLYLQALNRAFKSIEIKPRIWEKRGQTFEEYQKRDTSGIDKFIAIDPVRNVKIKTETNPNSIQGLKQRFRKIKGNSNFIFDGKKQKISSKFIRENLEKLLTQKQN